MIRLAFLAIKASTLLELVIWEYPHPAMSTAYDFEVLPLSRLVIWPCSFPTTTFCCNTTLAGQASPHQPEKQLYKSRPRSLEPP
jgi:hypothetical protein